MDDRTFRTAMGKFATGVTIITTQVGEEVYGMTANAFMSVSLNPKLVLVSIGVNANMNQHIKHAQKFAINILTKEQQEMSAYFAGQRQDAMEVDFNWFNDLPTIKDALVNVTCDVYDSVRAGDHTLYIGKVRDIYVSEGDPLAFYEGKYNQVKSFA